MIELECDKSLELFDYPLEIRRDVIFKYGDDLMELDEMTIQIPRNIDQLDVGQMIFEFIALGIPMRKVHPKYADDEETGNLFFLYFIGKRGKRKYSRSKVVSFKRFKKINI